MRGEREMSEAKIVKKERERERERENVSESMRAIEMDKRDWEKTVSLRTFFIVKFMF